MTQLKKTLLRDCTQLDRSLQNDTKLSKTINISFWQHFTQVIQNYAKLSKKSRETLTQHLQNITKLYQTLHSFTLQNCTQLHNVTPLHTTLHIFTRLEQKQPYNHRTQLYTSLQSSTTLLHHFYKTLQTTTEFFNTFTNLFCILHNSTKLYQTKSCFFK